MLTVCRSFRESSSETGVCARSTTVYDDGSAGRVAANCQLLCGPMPDRPAAGYEYYTQDQQARGNAIYHV